MKIRTPGLVIITILVALVFMATKYSAYSAEKTIGVTKSPAKRAGTVKLNPSAIEIISGAKMLAATSDKQNAVYIKWVLDNRWLPAKGFNLYRKGPGDTQFQKIAGPIKETSLGKINLKGLDGVAKQIDIGALQLSAKKPVTIPAEMSQIFKVNPVKPESAKSVFEELKSLKQRQFSPYTSNTRPTFDRFEPTSFTKLNAYYKRFNAAETMIPRGAAKSKGSMKSQLVTTTIGKETLSRKNVGGTAISKESTKTKTTPMSAKMPSPAIAVMDARRKLMLGALVNNQINTGLGLGYTDTDVNTGDSYEYQLKEINENGSEVNMPGASCSITVGDDPTPVQPTGLDAVQRGVKTVDLRWDLDAQKTPNTVISYNIFRTTAGQRKQVNGEPLMIGPVKDSNGNLIDMIFYFTDTDAPIGRIKYELIGSDIFGRQSPPAELVFNMADVETPNPPGKMTCRAIGNKVYVSWTPSIQLPPSTNQGAIALSKAEDKNAVYNVWRCDVEDTPIVWTKLTPSPIPYLHKIVAAGSSLPSGNFTDNTSQTDHRYRYQVTALYTKNMIESAPGAGADVAVPDLSQPKSPQNLTANFTAIGNQPGAAFAFDNRTIRKATVLTKTPARVRNLYKEPNQWKIRDSLAANKPKSGSSAASINTHNSLSLSYSGVAAANLSNSDLGGKVVLTWDAPVLTNPVRYKIWRADASGYTMIKEPTTEDKAAQSEPVDNKKPISLRASSKRSLKVLNTADAAKSRALIKGGLQESMPIVEIAGAKLEYLNKIPIEVTTESMWTLVGETQQPTFNDYLPKSRPSYYNYRVTITNRWGVESPMAAMGIRVPATIPPPTPEFSYTAPNLDGGVTLQWKALQNKEECTKYMVYRKKVDMSILSVPALNVIRFGLSQAPTGNNSDPSNEVSSTSSLSLGVTSSSVKKRKVSAPAKIIAPVKTDETVQKRDVTISPTVMEKAEKRGIRARVSMASLSPTVRKRIVIELNKPEEYKVVGEIGSDNIDSKGNVVYNDTKDLIPNEFYSYTIVALDADKWRSDASRPLMGSPFRVKADPPTNLKAVLNASTHGVNLFWDAPVKTGNEEIVGYFVQRSNAGSNNFIQVSDLRTENKWGDLAVMKGRSYSYRILSIDKQGNLSDPVQIDFAVPK